MEKLNTLNVPVKSRDENLHFKPSKTMPETLEVQPSKDLAVITMD